MARRTPRASSAWPSRRGGARPLVALSSALACACTFGVSRGGSPSWLPPLQERAQAARELTFRQPVEVRGAPAAALPGLLELELERLYPADLLGRLGQAGVAVGLYPPGTDLRRDLVSLLGDVVVGFFSPSQRRLYVALAEEGNPRKHRVPVADELVVIHELVHALQAMHSPLPDLLQKLRDQADLAFALGTLLEGDATWAELRDVALRGQSPLPAPAQVAADFGPGWLAAAHPEIPRALREPFALQYTLGYALVHQLTAVGGVAALNRALHDPPLSSEHVLHPERWLDPGRRDAPTAITLPGQGLSPERGCAELHRDTLGELGLRLWLEERGALRQAAEHAAAGWDGDRLVVFACPRGASFVWWLRFDRVTEAAEFLAMVRPWLPGLGASGGLASEVELEVDGRDVVLSAGMGAPLRAGLRDGVRLEETHDLAALLAFRTEPGGSPG